MTAALRIPPPSRGSCAVEPTAPEPAEASPAPVIVPALLGRRECAAYCGVSVASWDRLVAGGRTPTPVRLAGRVMLRRVDLDLWIEWGCPSRVDFERRSEAEK